MKLLTKFSLVNLLMMTIVFFTSSILLFLFTKAVLVKEIDKNLRGIERRTNNYVKQFNALPSDNQLGDEKISFFLTGQLKPERRQDQIQMRNEGEKQIHDFRLLVFPLYFNHNWYKVTAAKPVEGMHQVSGTLIKVAAATVLGIILISLLLNRFVLRRLWQPFYTSINTLRNFKLGQTASLNFPETTVNEFSFMNESLLLATEKAAQDYLLLKEFTENASHEIQTPLAIIRSKLDMLIQEAHLSEKQSEVAKEAYAAIKKLSRLNQSLLLLTKIENQQYNNGCTINLKEKIEEKITAFQELWQNRNITIKQELNESNLFISPELLDILMNNIFSNASNHNVASGEIYIRLNENELLVSNTGINGSLDEKRLFTRFYKTSVNSNHNGLGLSIVLQIAKVSSFKIKYRFANNRHEFILNW